jgi:hypothetical protein
MMAVEKFKVIERAYGKRKGKPIYDIPPDQAIWMVGRVPLDGLWPQDVPLLLLVLAPRIDWGAPPSSCELFVANIMESFGGRARQYRRQSFFRENGLALWLHSRTEAGYIDIARQSMPIGTFPADLAADVLRLELPALDAGTAVGSGPFTGQLHLFNEDDYRAAGWLDEVVTQPQNLGTGSTMTLPASLYCPQSPFWGTEPWRHTDGLVMGVLRAKVHPVRRVSDDQVHAL